VFHNFCLLECDTVQCSRINTVGKQGYRYTPFIFFYPEDGISSSNMLVAIGLHRTTPQKAVLFIIIDLRTSYLCFVSCCGCSHVSYEVKCLIIVYSF
jgi:hypothetical protein